MSNKAKLELTRIWKNKEINVEPRILIENPDLSFGDQNIENMLIHWDNLLALKALEQEYTWKIKCIYIDPPYNTGNAFEHYDDWLEHSIWLSLMKTRLELLNKLLNEEWIIFISIDDEEYHYLKILCDEVFWRKNYTGTFIWEKKKKPSFLNSQMWWITEYILSYWKDKDCSPSFTYWTTSWEETYPLYNAWNTRWILKFKSWSIKFPWLSDGVYPPADYKEDTSLVKLLSDLIIKNWENVNEVILEWEWRYWQKAIDEQILSWEYYVVKSSKFRPRRVLKNWDKDKKCHNLLSRAHYDMATYEDSSKESISLFGADQFDYPKPEKLLHFLIWAVTSPWDIVLDSFLWSWTTCAVAHKMWRKWIWIELWDHCYTHCKVRLDKVIKWEDKGWITDLVNWQWWGGYKFYELWPSLLSKDKYENFIINPNMFDWTNLIQALCKIENFTYKSFDDWIRHWFSTEKDFIHITTRFVSQDIVNNIQESLPKDATLLIMTTNFDQNLILPDSIQVKKIPREILEKYEYNKDNYNLPVE